jgi:hypothetical protein
MRAPIYKYSLAEARELDEESLWLESHKANVECKRGIEQAIRENFDGMRLNGGVVKSLCDEYGIDRVKFVLATTISENSEDGRYRPDNKEWAKSVFIPEETENRDFCVNSHPEVINGLASQYRRYLRQDLGLLDKSDCVRFDEPQDYTGRLLILGASTLKDEYKQGKYQYFFAYSGFGCDPSATGTKVFGEFLYDGEETHFHRGAFIGIADESKLPDWALERLEEIRTEIDEGETQSLS